MGYFCILVVFERYLCNAWTDPHQTLRDHVIRLVYHAICPTTDGKKASRGLSTTAELLVIIHTACRGGLCCPCLWHWLLGNTVAVCAAA